MSDEDANLESSTDDLSYSENAPVTGQGRMDDDGDDDGEKYIYNFEQINLVKE